MQKTTIQILGSSHISAIWVAINERNKFDLKNDYALKSLMDFRNDSRIIEPIIGGFENYYLNNELRSWLLSLNQIDRLVLSISGSDYLPFCIANSEPLFDIILPNHPHLPKIENAQLIPYQEMKKKLRQYIRHVVLGIKVIKDIVPVPIFYLESPPPIEDNNYLLKNPGWASHMIDKSGLSFPALRLKLWQLHSEIVKEMCDQVGVTFLSVPRQCLNEQGFLNEMAFFDDLMHANSWYGNEILNQLEADL